MKKVILSSVLAAAAIGSMTPANAASTVQVFCSGASGNGTAADASSSSTSFVKVAFVPKCSSNTNVLGSDSDAYYRVGSSSAKGKTVFAGSTMGGGVVAAGNCASSTGCTSAEASTALQSTFAATS
jgi:hypothetical protein